MKAELGTIAHCSERFASRKEGQDESGNQTEYPTHNDSNSKRTSTFTDQIGELLKEMQKITQYLHCQVSGPFFNICSVKHDYLR